MKKRCAASRLTTLLVLMATLAGLMLHFFTDEASADSPDPTPTFELKTKPEESQPSAYSLISPANVIASGVVTFYATADAQVLQGVPATNYGIGSPMHTGRSGCSGDPPGVARSLIRFDLSHVPPGTTINSARLFVDLAESCDSPGQSLPITPYQVTAGWSEEEVTWNTQPTLGSTYPPVSVPHAGWGWYSFDVTNLVRNWVSSASNYGIMLRGPESAPGWRGFSTKTSGRYSYGPRLVVNLVVPPATLSTAPTSLVFINDVGGPVTQTKELVIQNPGDNTLNWSASESISWLSLDKTSGTTQFTLPDTLRVSVNKSGLNPGHYTGQVQITSDPPGAPGSPKLVQVTFNLVQSLPHIYLPVVLKDGSNVTPTRDVVVLAIGISDYEYMEPPLGQTFERAGAPGLDTIASVTDSQAFSNIMLSKKSGLSSSNVKILSDAWASKEAIRQVIISWLRNLVNKNTIVIIFFSGHGMYAPDDNGDEIDGYDEFIVPYGVQYDSQEQIWLPETAIRDDELDAWLDLLEAYQIVLIIDSCFSGGIVTGASVTSGEDFLNPRGLGVGAADLRASDGFAQDVNQSQRMVLMASTASQSSWEFSELEHGAFTYYLLQALSSTSADTNRNNWVSAEEAFTYLAGRVDDYVLQKTSEHQNPQISDGVAGEVNLTQP